MQHLIKICTLTFLVVSCGQNNNKQKELELKERELAIKEKELEQKQSQKTSDTPTSTIHQESKTTDLPFIGTKTFCIKKDVDESTGSLSVTIKGDGAISYKGNLKNNGMCEDGCDLEYTGKLKGFKANSGDGKILFSNSNTFHWEGEEDDFTASVCSVNNNNESAKNSFVGTWVSDNGKQKLIIKKISGNSYDVKHIENAEGLAGLTDPMGSATLNNDKLIMDDGWGTIIYANGKLYCDRVYYSKK